MPTLAIVSGMAILLYYADHDPPHFHVRAPNFRAKIALADLRVIEVEGRMRAADLSRLRSWAAYHRDALYDNWHRVRRGEPPFKVEE